AAGAAAQSDVMCICADDEASATCGGNVDAAAFSQLTLYFCVLDPSEPEIKAWEAYLEIEGEDNLQGAWRVLGEGINFAPAPEFQVGITGAPLTPNNANLIPLLSMHAFILNEAPILFFIRPVPGSLGFPDLPGYACYVADPRPCTPCGTENWPSFTINSAAEDEEKAWGEVKSLYDR
ncbi:hypothetical protein KKG45_01655, partial [bacterium]|nr:hypothetical protein [bacterium]